MALRAVRRACACARSTCLATAAPALALSERTSALADLRGAGLIPVKKGGNGDPSDLRIQHRGVARIYLRLAPLGRSESTMTGKSGDYDVLSLMICDVCYDSGLLEIGSIWPTWGSQQDANQKDTRAPCAARRWGQLHPWMMLQQRLVRHTRQEVLPPVLVLPAALPGSCQSPLLVPRRVARCQGLHGRQSLSWSPPLDKQLHSFR